MGAWLVMKQSHLFINKYVEAALIRGNLRLLPTFTDEHNLKLNAACGVWQYLSQIWETNIQKGDLVGDQVPLLDNIVQCFKDMDNQCVKLIADAYNNNQILELLGNKKEVAQKSIINQETNSTSVIEFNGFLRQQVPFHDCELGNIQIELSSPCLSDTISKRDIV